MPESIDTCPVTGKLMYPTMRVAMGVVNRLLHRTGRKRRASHKPGIGAYWCVFCRAVHVGTDHRRGVRRGEEWKP